MDHFLDNETYFREAYEVYKADFLRYEIPRLSDTIVPSFEKTLSRTCQDVDKPITILSVGAGDGKPDLFLLQELFRQFPTFKDRCIIYTVIELNRGYVTQFQNAAKENSEVLKNVEFRWLCGTFEELVYADGFASKFDIIILYHVLYYMEVEKTLEKCMSDLLKPNGCAFCVVLTEEDCTRKLFLQYRSKRLELWSGFRVISIEELKKLASEHQWRFEECTADGTLEVAAIFEPGSRKGNLLLDFAFHTNNAVEVLGPDLLNDVLETLRGMRVTQGSSEGTEFRVTKQKGMLLIYKE